MEKVMVIGPFNEAMGAALKAAIPADRFELEFIGESMEYDWEGNADYIILRTLSIDAKQMGHLKKVKLIQRWGAGFDTVDIKAAGERGIQVAVTAGMNATPVAEMALALALAVYRNLVPLTNDIMDGRWSREEYSKRSYTIAGKTAGIFGGGNIGRKVARLYKAFGADVIYYDPCRMPLEQEQEIGMKFVSLECLWRESDILTLHAPLTEETQQIMNTDTLARMKHNAVLINTAREELVDYQAAAKALRDGKLLGAGFDAIEASFVEHNPFRGMPNVVLTSHLGGNTVDNAVHMARRCAEQIMAVSRGERLSPPHLVNGQYLK